MLLEQRPPLALGLAAPNTELHLVVERVGEALGSDRTVPANNSRIPLRGSANKELVGLDGTTPRFGYPDDSGFDPTSARTVVRNRDVASDAGGFHCIGRDCGDQAACVHQIFTCLLSFGV